MNRPAQLRVHKYYRGEVYLNTEFEKILQERFFLPALRPPEVSQWISLEQAQEVRDARFSYGDYLRRLARVTVLDSDFNPWRQLDLVQDFIETVPQNSNVADLADLASVSDQELKQKVNEQWVIITKYTSFSMILWMVYASQMMNLFGRVIEAWYDGDNAGAFADLCQGVPRDRRRWRRTSRSTT